MSGSTKTKVPKLNLTDQVQQHSPIEGSSKVKDSNKQQETIKEKPPATQNGLPDLLTPKHLRNYPLVTSTESLIKFLPLVSYVTSFSKYSFTTIRNYQPCKYVIETGDLYSDMLLSKLDSFIPSLQTVEVNDLTNPITTPINHAVETVNSKINLVNETVNKNVINPTKSKIDNVKNDIHQRTHDDNGKNIITKSTIDPIIGPFNETLEQFVTNHFPDKKINPNEDEGNLDNTNNRSCEFTSELKRTFNIVGNIISKESKETVEVNVVDLKNQNQNQPEKGNVGKSKEKTKLPKDGVLKEVVSK
ncbi:uncharacterized protein KGF55_003884 [Candida pseudojiufengensis]|uniref:uncharacterized protein n=1 Tax=Candida pseudojiufengensis TaxID=497109 RepID=UPI00222478E4|nr:uncharacterized protein KGF55_003884 [Candida pseudojiufengensis]KAI5961913.1 hypothetical protein KGF55_003884 [Candida pseudojiufengensis]